MFENTAEESDDTLKSRALMYWANHIETGTMHLSAKDIINCYEPKDRHKYTIDLNDDQKRLVLRLRELAIKR